MSHEVLTVEGLTKTYGHGGGAVRANDHVCLTVGAGEVCCLLGHNGAGKSTLANQVVGLALPDSGRIRLAGVDVLAHPTRARQLASVQAQANVPITGLSPHRAITLVGRIRGLRRTEADRRATELLTALDLLEWAERPAEKVSGGVARLTAFAMAVVAPGRLVILDEPTNDVDPVRRRLLWARIRQVADTGIAVPLITHNVLEAETVVDTVTLLDRGQVVAAGPPADIKAAGAATSLEEAYINLVGQADAHIGSEVAR